VNGDNLSVRFTTESSVDAVAALIDGLIPDNIEPIPNAEVMDNLKFSACLPPQIAAEVFSARFADPIAIQRVLTERRQVVVEA
jgi:hypothetical protein